MWSNLETNVHKELMNKFPSDSYFIKGDYKYFHYKCDGIDDRGWGCGYRCLQTICSWMRETLVGLIDPPKLFDIQEMLVWMEDKPRGFVYSKEWIGCFEACFIIEKLYLIESKIIHVKKGESLEPIVEVLKEHFQKFGSPVMMGGDVDCSAKCIMGVHVEGPKSEFLIVDPHYIKTKQKSEDPAYTTKAKWLTLNDFMSTSFYNLCLPQVEPPHPVHDNSNIRHRSYYTRQTLCVVPKPQ